MKKIKIFSIAFLMTFFANGQSISPEVITSTGDYYSNSNVSLSWTLGEPVIETFEAGGFVLTQGFQQVDFTGVQMLYISQGWSGISTFIIPAETHIENMFAPVGIQLTILQNLSGVYWPEEGVNTLGQWDFKSGYIIKTSADVSLCVKGYSTDDKSISLPSGWSLIPVLSSENVPISVFDPMIANLMVVKEIAGIGIYWPEMGINTLNILSSGKSYFVMLTNADILSFNGYTKNAISPEQFVRTTNSWWNAEHATPASHIVAINKEALAVFSPGDFIGAFTGEGFCAGQIMVETNPETSPLIIFGDDLLTNEKDGFASNETLSFRLFRAIEGNEQIITPHYSPAQPDADGKFIQNGLSVITGFDLLNVSPEGTENYAINIYPNPSSGNFRISGLDGEAKIIITTICGEVVAEICTHGNNIARVDMTQNQPGIYIANISNSNNKMVKIKMCIWR